MTFDEYVAGVVAHLLTPADAINERHLLDWCEQRWNSRPRGGLTPKVFRDHAKAYDREIHDGLYRQLNSTLGNRTDRRRRVSTRTA